MATEYIRGCNSLFAARIVEKRVMDDASFPLDCTVPLTGDVGLLKPNGNALCRSGESANACRDRIYETPPSMSELPPGCWNGSGPDGCLRSAWLPRCADGTDTCATPQVICQDGTRPMIRAEAATAGPSGVWHFHMGGEGGPCTGDQCWFNYRFARFANDVPFEKAMSTLHPDYGTQASETGTGVMAGTMAQQNPFAGHNRVHFERCTDAASDAEEDVLFGDGLPAEWMNVPAGAPIRTRVSTAHVWYRGFNTWKAAFHMLAAPAGYDLDGDGTPDLPSLSAATTVVLSGSSDASNWVVFAADRLADELRTIAPNVQVKILIDGHFEPTLDNEGRYHASAPAPFNMFDQDYGATGLCLLPDNGDGIANEACSDATYRPGPRPSGAPSLRDSLDTRGIVRDASCEAMHGAGAPECSNKSHTQYHHLATPFLVLADQEDRTISASGAQYADDPSYAWANPETYRARILDQADDIEAFWATASREEGAGTVGNAALILPKSRRNTQPWGAANHVHFGDNMKMASRMTECTANGTAVASVSYGRMIDLWIDGMAQRYFVKEDASSWDGVSNYFVTGDVCRPPE